MEITKYNECYNFDNLALFIYHYVLSGPIMLWMQFISFNKTVKMHSHAMHEFLICSQGCIVVRTEASEYILEKGSSLFIPSNIPHEIIPNDHLNGVLIACIDNPLLCLMRTPNNRDYIDSLTIQVSQATPIECEVEELISILDKLIELKQHRNKFNQSLEENCFLRMLLLHARRQQSFSMFRIDEQGQIKQLYEWLKENYHTEINIDKLCVQFGMSRSQLTRKFKHYCGYSVIEYVSQLRFEEAARMLAMTNKDVSEIALASGISNLSHFHRQFKKRYGMTPIKFRNMTT